MTFSISSLTFAMLAYLLFGDDIAKFVEDLLSNFQ